MPISGEDLAALKAAIVAQHGSVYRFCKASGLSKGLLSQLLRGVYGGSAERQLRRVREALAGSGLATRVLRALENAACARCRRANTPRCTRESCSRFFAAQAAAVMEEISRTETGWGKP